MKIDLFNHIFPKKYFDKMLELFPNGADMHKRVRNVPSIVELDVRFKMMDLFDHRTEYYSIHTSAKDLTPEDATKGVPVPFHPGAEKYLREIGAMKK
jgi:hypothetical protein